MLSAVFDKNILEFLDVNGLRTSIYWILNYIKSRKNDRKIMNVFLLDWTVLL